MGTSTDIAKTAVRPAVPTVIAPGDRNRSPRFEIPALTGMRIVFCLLIVAHHAVLWVAADNPNVQLEDWQLLRQGAAGTTGFFVLSGLALAWAWGHRFTPGTTMRQWGSFVRRRAAAIVPIAVLGVLLSIPYEQAAGHVEGATFWGWLALNLAQMQSLLPFGGGELGPTLRFNGPTWTLSTLLVLYMCFPALAVAARYVGLRRAAAVVAAAWLALLCASWTLADSEQVRWFFHVHPLARIVDFSAGIVAGLWLARRGRRPLRAATACQVVAVGVLTASIVVVAGSEVAPAMRNGAWHLPAVLLICVTFAATSGAGITRFLGHPAMQWAGRHAFALLMVHTPIFATVWLWGGFEDSVPRALAVSLALSALATVAAHRWWERPLRRRLRGA